MAAARYVPGGFNVTTDEMAIFRFIPKAIPLFHLLQKCRRQVLHLSLSSGSESASKGEMNPEDNVEEFDLLDEKELEHWRTACNKAHASGKAALQL